MGNSASDTTLADAGIGEQATGNGQRSRRPLSPLDLTSTHRHPISRTQPCVRLRICHQYWTCNPVQLLGHQCAEEDDVVGFGENDGGRGGPGVMASASTLDDDDEPRPDGITRIRPVTIDPNWVWWPSINLPVSGSSPPHIDRGSSRTSTTPVASPARSSLTSMPSDRWRSCRRLPTRRTPRGCRRRCQRRDSPVRSRPSSRSSSSPLRCVRA